ncbi:MAG: DUF1599 domain-containing protein [Flavobacteriales bacterium]|nr:DUF1599 domain-containing protein [Flavobacteriales bacterium]
MSNTSEQYTLVVNRCKDIFFKKMKDYGTSWRILKATSLTDQIFIKAKRISTIQENRIQKIEEDISSEYIGIINYCVIGLIQLEKGNKENLKLGEEETTELYEHYINEAKSLMELKNHDYGEAWRDMRVSSLTDLILMKLLRVKQIEDNEGETIISEGIDASYYDIINYAIFAMIRLNELTEA